MLLTIPLLDQVHTLYETGVYEFPSFNSYNFIGRSKQYYFEAEDGFEWSISGVCDNYNQVKEKYADILNDDNKQKYIIALYKVQQKFEPQRWGWRWKKFGDYIGKHKIEKEYLYDEDLSDINQDHIYCFRILRVG